ncbi:MAG: hypothetical protein KJS92_05875 [Bacteroidetes bacterium]|nr:hypothetical protein [Bacteroidota bacterium]
MNRIIFLLILVTAVACKSRKPVPAPAPVVIAPANGLVRMQAEGDSMMFDSLHRPIMPDTARLNHLKPDTFPSSPANSMSMAVYNKLMSDVNIESDREDVGSPSNRQQFLDILGTQYPLYRPDPAKLSQLRNALQGVEIYVAGGAWCDDTRREVPRLVSLLDQCDFPAGNFHYSGVNRAKKPLNENGFAAKPGLTLVPLIAVYRNGVELGRITEIPKKSLEADLLDILR